MTELKTSELLQEQGFNEPIKVHKGFKSKFLGSMTHFSYVIDWHSNQQRSLARTDYLFDDDIEAENRDEIQAKVKPHGKYGKILDDLKACYNFEEDGKKVHEGFSLYVTGHRYV
jgi:hypothetical protein